MVYFDDVAKLKDPDPANWKQWPTLSTSENNPLVGVLFYNPTDNKFYFFGYKKFESKESSVVTGGGGMGSKARDQAEKKLRNLQWNYKYNIRLKLVESLMTTQSSTPRYNLEYWSHILGSDGFSGVAGGGSILGEDNFNYYLTFSDGALKYTIKNPPGVSLFEYFSKTFHQLNKEEKLSSSPSTTMLSSLTLADPKTTTTTPGDGTQITCTWTKRAYLFYKLPDTYKEKYDPTPGLMKTDSMPLETADKLIEEITRAQAADSSKPLLPPPPSESPVLNFHWFCKY